MIARLLRKRFAAPSRTVPPGQRVYAIGDIHGRLDLLTDLLAQIEADEARRGPAKTTIISLGDLIDRGTESAGVVERLRKLAIERENVRFLLGNHEEVFLAALGGDLRALRLFDRIGGATTMLSYGIAPEDYSAMSFPEILAKLQTLVPQEHIDFLRGFEDMIEIGDYVFVHAGIRPNVRLDAQRVQDLRWIRDDFLDHRGAFERVVVHGHSISDAVEELPNRIGLDTGAFASGRLTAMGFEGGERWILDTRQTAGR